MSLVPDNIINDLERHKRDKTVLLEFYIQKRLNSSLLNYERDMQNIKERLNKSYKYRRILKNESKESTDD